MFHPQIEEFWQKLYNRKGYCCIWSYDPMHQTAIIANTPTTI